MSRQRWVIANIVADIQRRFLSGILSRIGHNDASQFLNLAELPESEVEKTFLTFRNETNETQFFSNRIWRVLKSIKKLFIPIRLNSSGT